MFKDLIACEVTYWIQLVPGDTGDHATEAMQAIANAVSQCKFEATDPAADEVVLYKILQVCLKLYENAAVVLKALW